MQAQFIEISGGTNDEKEIAKNVIKNMKQGAEEFKEKVSTYEQTRTLVKKGLSIQDIAESRGMTTGTIISHLEKLKKCIDTIDFSHFKPKEKDLKKIKQAFIDTGDTKLAPVRSLLDKKYSYEELRLARLFL